MREAGVGGRRVGPAQRLRHQWLRQRQQVLHGANGDDESEILTRACMVATPKAVLLALRLLVVGSRRQQQEDDVARLQADARHGGRLHNEAARVLHRRVAARYVLHESLHKAGVQSQALLHAGWGKQCDDAIADKACCGFMGLRKQADQVCDERFLI